MWLGLICLSLPATVTSAAPPKPNIVHILTDDLGWQDPVCFDVDGETPFETPNLDRLAKHGRKFMQAYSPSPTCAPSRAAYISGQYPAHTGIYHVLGGKLPRAYSPNFTHINPFYRYRLPLTEMTIPKELKKAGYATGHVGKWHLGGRSNGYPFPGNYGFDIGYVDDLGKGGTYYPDPDIWGPRVQLRDQHNGLAKSMKPHRLTGWATDDPKDPFQLDKDGRPFDKTLDVALKWLEKHHAEPFFLNYCTYYVHSPIQTRNRERLEYYCKKMGYEFPTDPGVTNKGRGGKTDPYYATMVDTLDWMIGKVVTYLEETDDPRNPGHKLLDNTYIIVSSDNGGLVKRSGGTITDNSPLRAGKQDIHEGGVRVPFIVRGPNVPVDSVCETPISLIDLYPTFVDLAGLPPSQNPKLDGCNIRPLIEGRDTVARFADGSSRERIFFYYPIELSAGCAMRKGPWKIYRNLSPGNNKSPLVELFRLYNDDGTMADVGERNNLAEEMPELTNQLLAELDEFLTEANVSYPFKNPGIDSHPKHDNVPKVVERGDNGDRIWVEVETGENKSAIVDAKLLYTVNGSLLEASRGRREMWFEEPAEIRGGHIEGTVPPGTSHATFCMRDSEGFLVMSEELPTYRERPSGTADSSYLKHGYAFRPGLFALIRLGKAAENELRSQGKNAPLLHRQMQNAERVYESRNVSEEQYCDTIRGLRGSIRDLKGVAPQADNYYLNLFREGGAF
ncbi:N-acetylgalactosamine 6-sulfate sulfatase (GALNS) [Rhodopirellula sallentina SM41]|uniref:N-acetylgalactosamine 6-sulfate sulfatase (GALNS) n=2 Tax=Rhodopirellula TaxID=265488 RepID=M5U2E9_9BACT|nr:N-acetylgalactosamine 6-sulfate sulfatase (GALNS) [Rhodopirellula sallentina SM41]